MKIKFFYLIILAFITLNAGANPEPPVEGKEIFLSRCAGCHNVNKKLTGPALAGIDERRSIDWIINFIHSSQAMVKKGDKDALAVYEQFNRLPMPDHTDLSEESIRSIVEYIKSETKAVGESAAPFAKPGKKRAMYQLVSGDDYWLFGAFIGSVLLLIAILAFAVRVRMLRDSMHGKID